jgi:hypothetical protein
VSSIRNVPVAGFRHAVIVPLRPGIAAVARPPPASTSAPTAQTLAKVGRGMRRDSSRID